MIYSRQNPQVLLACGLADKKKRRRSGLFRFDGIKLLEEALRAGTEVISVFVRFPMSEAAEGLIRKALEEHLLTEEKILPVSESVFEKLSEERAPEGILTVARFMDDLHQRAEREELAGLSFEGEKLLIAESLRDAGNLGTVIRSCAALGIHRLILTEDCAELYNPKTVRGAMGALFRLPTLTVENETLPDMIRCLRDSGRRVFAAALREGAEEVGKLRLSAGDCFVIGNEGHGLSQRTIEACDQAAIIPMMPQSESLNAAAAAAICIWETVRAR